MIIEMEYQQEWHEKEQALSMQQDNIKEDYYSIFEADLDAEFDVFRSIN